MLAKMKSLIAQLREADTAYYGKDDPIMTDLEYDRLYGELVQLEQDTGIILTSSPTQQVSGEVLESLTAVPHTKPMLSADKTKSTDEIFKFIGGRKVVISWKLDGLTLVLRYEGGKLVQAITRGDGLKGEDVTHTVRVMENVPLTIPCTEPLEVRGEGVVSWQNFKELNESLEEPYSHPRNLAAGTIRKLDAKESKKRRLEFLAFDLISDHLGGTTKWENLRFMAQMGFTTVGYSVLAENAPQDALEKAIAAYRPEDYAFPVDGLIFEYDDLAYGRSLGATGHHENRLIALKWADTLYETVFRSLEVATTRTGMVSLTGVFDDVEIDGTTVNHAYLHNLDIFMQLAPGPGDKISVYKANMIIPQIAENHTKSGGCPIPSVCPCCGEMLMIHTSPGGTRQLYCENLDCPARLVRKFVHFCSKTRMEIEGLAMVEAELAIGLPPEHYELRNRFAEYFKRGTVQFKFNDAPVSLMIRQVLVYPQAYAAVVPQAQIIQQNPRTFVVDIGGFTTDVLLLRGVQPDMQFCRSLEMGAIPMANGIIGRVSALHDIKIDDDHIADVIQGRPTILPNDVQEAIRTTVKSYAAGILDKLRELQVDLRATPAIFTGGGAALFRPFIEASPQVAKAEFVGDPKANAVGFGMLATAQQRQMQAQKVGEGFAQG